MPLSTALFLDFNSAALGFVAGYGCAVVNAMKLHSIPYHFGSSDWHVLPDSHVHLVGVSKERIYNTVTMTPEVGLAILQDAKNQATKMFDDPASRKLIAEHIRTEFEKQVAEALRIGKISENKANELLADQKDNMDVFVDNGSSKTMGILVHMPQSISVGYWHCHVTSTLSRNLINPRDGVNVDDVIAVFQRPRSFHSVLKSVKFFLATTIYLIIM
jgi:hypothetical protein